MNYDREREDHDADIRDLLEQARRAANSRDELPDDDLLFPRRGVKKPKPKKEDE